MVPFSMTLNDPLNPDFKVIPLFYVECLRNDKI